MRSIHLEEYRRAIEALVTARKKGGITQVELARLIDQTQAFISKYETGERRLDVAEYLHIARAVGADPYKLLKQAEGATKAIQKKTNRRGKSSAK